MRRYNDLTIWFAAFLLVFSAGCSDNDKAGVTQTVTPPTVISVTPLSAATACSNTLVTATFSKAMNPATINGATFTLTGPGTTAVGGAVTYDAPRDTATFTSTVTLALGTAYTVTITTGATDMYGNALARRCRIGASRPKRPPASVPAPPTSGDPFPAGPPEYAPDTVVVATFPAGDEPGNDQPNDLYLDPRRKRNCHPRCIQHNFYLHPVEQSGSEYGLHGHDHHRSPRPFGNMLATSFVWSFTTAANGGVKTPAPSVISVAPASGAASICPNTIVTAAFSEAMNPATIDGTTFTLMGPGTAAVAGVVSYDGSSDTAIFTPSSRLALNSVYTATITVGAQDMFGNPLVSNVVWIFTTGANPCLPPAPPISVTPPIGSSGNMPQRSRRRHFSAGDEPCNP